MTAFRLLAVLVMALLTLSAILLGPAGAQGREVPYWASLRFDEVRMRVGPGRDYPIAWVYRREGLPVTVVRKREGWRLVRDHEGTQGWVASSQLTLKRGAMVRGQGNANLHAEPATDAAINWRAEPGVIGELRRCVDDWCAIDVAGRSGWVREARLWGAGEPEP
jgi:SH3-like domain-containing protein